MSWSRACATQLPTPIHLYGHAPLHGYPQPIKPGFARRRLGARLPLARCRTRQPTTDQARLRTVPVGGPTPARSLSSTPKRPSPSRTVPVGGADSLTLAVEHPSRPSPSSYGTGWGGPNSFAADQSCATTVPATALSRPIPCPHGTGRGTPLPTNPVASQYRPTPSADQSRFHTVPALGPTAD